MFLRELTSPRAGRPARPTCARRWRCCARGRIRAAELITHRFPLEETGAALAAQRDGEALKAVVRAVRAALLHGAEDLRVVDVPDPVPAAGEVLVRVEAATTCGTDVKMWRRGHPLLAAYPARFGHETAGVREDTGERVLVGDSVACGTCRHCRAGRPQICRDPRWLLGGFAELIAAPEAALHAVPDGLEPRGAAMAEPLAAAVHAVARAPAARSRPTPACSAAARWARCSPRCWSPRAARSRSPTATPSAARRPRRRAR